MEFEFSSINGGQILLSIHPINPSHDTKSMHDVHVHSCTLQELHTATSRPQAPNHTSASSQISETTERTKSLVKASQIKLGKPSSANQRLRQPRGIDGPLQRAGPRAKSRTDRPRYLFHFMVSPDLPTGSSRRPAVPGLQCRNLLGQGHCLLW